jgi:hypothetical protein
MTDRRDIENRPTAYALLDGARDDSVASSPDHLLVDASIGLYVVPLRSAPELQVVLQRPVTPMIVTSTASDGDLFAYFRGLVTVETEDGESLFFRFHDPRVLSVFLPTCSSEQLTEVFGPVSEFYVPVDGGHDFDGFHRSARGLVTIRLTREELLQRC